jgi:hypothetical protein
MATPHVAGAWALIKQAVPFGSVTDILAALRTSGVGITSTCDGRNLVIPRIRVDRAITALGKYTLTIQASQYGTTIPPPGAYRAAENTQFPVTAAPADFADFVGWTGAATGKANPVSVLMNADKTIVANFQYIYAPPSSGRRVNNRSFSQVEYVDVLTWQPNPSNQGLDINRYWIYRNDAGTWTFLTEVAAGPSTFEHQQRHAAAGSTQYLIVAVTINDRAGAGAVVTIQ